MDGHTVDSFVQAVGLVLAWKGWDHIVWPWLKSRREVASVAPHPSNGNGGFTRDDHASLAVLEAKIDHVDQTLGRLDNAVGRLVLVLELHKLQQP